MDEKAPETALVVSQADLLQDEEPLPVADGED